jgi:hypothetical protein
MSISEDHRFPMGITYLDHMPKLRIVVCFLSHWFSVYFSDFTFAMETACRSHAERDCRLPESQDFRVFFIGFVVFFSPLRQIQLADHMPSVL